MNLDDLVAKWSAFGWDVQEIDGHNYNRIDNALRPQGIKPQLILANTIKGKGVSFMEDKLEWHYKNIDDESYRKALNELS